MSLAPSYLETAATEALSRGNAAEAERLVREALRKDPKDYRCRVMLAHLLRMRGEAMEAAGEAEVAIQLKPQVVEAHFQSGLALLDLNRPEGAAAAFRKAIEIRPEIWEFHLHLGFALEIQGKVSEANRCFTRAMKLDPKDLRARISLARLLLQQGEIYAAQPHAEAALRAAPNASLTNLTMAEVLNADGDTRQSEAYVRKALEIDPANPTAHAMLGMRFSNMGLFEEAEREFAKSLELQPDQGLAYLYITQAKKVTEADRELLARMEALRDENRVVGNEWAALHFALAKAYENLGRYEEAMAAYDEAHRCAFETRFGGVDPGEADREARLSTLQSLYTKEVLERPLEGAEQSSLPIFIVGTIRSGTTLTEQILSSHPDVAAAGEQKFWIRNAGTDEYAEQLAHNPQQAIGLAKDYLSILSEIGPEAKHVTDKLPGNYLRLGLLHQVLPNAKIIHCRRNPIDAAISIYVTPNGSANASLLTKEGIVKAYHHYLALMEHWRAVLPPNRFLEIRYEDLVNDPEPVIRRILDFCDLEWNEACLSPERNSKEVNTPSLWQVRQPIYKTSVERWRKFEPWLGAFRGLIDLQNG